jgi:hypothetical protein
MRAVTLASKPKLEAGFAGLGDLVIAGQLR